jgi:hypothetical protein
VADVPGPLAPAAQARRRRRLAWIVPVAIGVPLVAVLVVAFREHAGLVVLVLGFVALVAVISVLLRRADLRKRAAGRPAVERALDADAIRAATARGGPAAGAREVRRQAPWLSLGEAAAEVDRLGR